MTVTQGWFPVVSRLIDLLLEQEVSRGGQVRSCFDNCLWDAWREAPSYTLVVST